MPTTFAQPGHEGQRLLLHDVTWRSYDAFLQALGERPAVRLTFDRGRLEIMTTSPLHERLKKLVARFIETLTEELNIPICSGGSMTFKREDLDRGLEPDECYWIASELAMRGKTAFDPLIDPPPDLVIEIEVSRTLVDRMSILAALGVGEIWRFNGTSLTIWQRVNTKEYAPCEHSPSFPFLPLRELSVWLQRSGELGELDETSLIRTFRLWVREQAAAGWAKSS